MFTVLIKIKKMKFYLSTHPDIDIPLKTITRNDNKICILFYYLSRLSSIKQVKLVILYIELVYTKFFKLTYSLNYNRSTIPNIWI
jgi:hypothetical protein